MTDLGEREDRNQEPIGLVGFEDPEAARLFMVADVYDQIANTAEHEVGQVADRAAEARRDALDRRVEALNYCVEKANRAGTPAEYYYYAAPVMFPDEPRAIDVYREVMPFLHEVAQKSDGVMVHFELVAPSTDNPAALVVGVHSYSADAPEVGAYLETPAVVPYDPALPAEIQPSSFIMLEAAQAVQERWPYFADNPAAYAPMIAVLLEQDVLPPLLIGRSYAQPVIDAVAQRASELFSSEQGQSGWPFVSRSIDLSRCLYRRGMVELSDEVVDLLEWDYALRLQEQHDLCAERAFAFAMSSSRRAARYVLHAKDLESYGVKEQQLAIIDAENEGIIRDKLLLPERFVRKAVVVAQWADPGRYGTSEHINPGQRKNIIHLEESILAALLGTTPARLRLTQTAQQLRDIHVEIARRAFWPISVGNFAAH